MLITKTRLQQQPARFINRQQQQSSGSGEFQPRRIDAGGEGYVNQADGAVHDRPKDDRRRGNIETLLSSLEFSSPDALVLTISIRSQL